MSLAPYASANCPILSPCVTQLLWMFGTLSKYSRATACVLRYSKAPVGGILESCVLSGWKVQQMNAVKPWVSSCNWRIRSRCSTLSASVSTCPNIIVTVLTPPSSCHTRMTFSQSSVMTLPRVISLRTRSTKISAPPPGMLPSPASLRCSRTVRIVSLFTLVK